IMLRGKNTTTSGTMKRTSTYGRVGKRKKGLLIGYDRIMTSKYHIRREHLLTNVHNLTSWEEGARSRYAKSIILQKESSLLLKDVIHWGHKNEEVNKKFLRLVKDSLYCNPLNIGSLFNLVYFYFTQIGQCGSELGGSPSEQGQGQGQRPTQMPMQKPTKKPMQGPTQAERSCLLYSHLLHSILMHIGRGQFSREKKAVMKAKLRGRNIRVFFFSLFRDEVKKESFQMRLVRRVWERWNDIPSMSDQLLLIICVENLHMLCVTNYRMGFMRDVFYYANLLLHLLQLRRLRGLLKANHFSLSASLCMAKAACFVLASSGDPRIHHSTGARGVGHLNEVGHIRGVGDLHEVGDLNEVGHIRRVGDSCSLHSEDVRLDKTQNGVKARGPSRGVDLKTDDSGTTRCSTNGADKEGLTLVEEPPPHNTLLYCEERFLSFLLSEKETVMRAKHVVEEDYILEEHVQHPLSSVVNKLNLCINHCLSYREYHFLTQFLVWRARLYYHVGLFRECLSDTSKVALINLHARAPLRIDSDEGGGGRSAKYSCLGLMLSCLRRLNLLRASDSYLLIPLKRGGTGSCYTWEGKTTCTPTGHKEKNHTLNKREHPYSWCRPPEDKALLRVLHGNRKKIPFTL
ncbi:hypothetical protein PCYB_123260, partial [Plasmodium cynomolgi strain B]